MNYAVILSGGIGTRMRDDGFPKQYLKVQNKPILIYTLEKFEACKSIDKIVVVAADEWKDTIYGWKNTYGISKLLDVTHSGGTRQESIQNGLKVCVGSRHKNDDNVIIHDAVRPLVSTDLITSCLNALDDYEGCMPILPLNDTVYMSTNGTEISQLLDRNLLFAGQSPEAFRLWKYYEINCNTNVEELKNIHGTTELAYKNNLKIKLVKGEDTNFKLTTPADLQRFEMIIGESNESL